MIIKVSWSIVLLSSPSSKTITDVRPHISSQIGHQKPGARGNRAQAIVDKKDPAFAGPKSDLGRKHPSEDPTNPTESVPGLVAE
jgi:hypothetical protein